MAYNEGHARDEPLLLPASVEDCVAADISVRSIDVLIDDFDPGSDFHGLRLKATWKRTQQVVAI